MIDAIQLLAANWHDPALLQHAATRDGLGKALLELGRSNPHLVVVSADLAESTRVDAFAKAFPDRFFEVGVAEQNMLGVAAGFALSGKIPFAASYAVFSPGRNWDQLRVSVCYSKANVKIIGGHAGITVGPDGATHQALEDIALTRVLPNITVLVPADVEEAYKATLAAAALPGPVYLRMGRHAVPSFTIPQTPFEIGKANLLRAGRDLTIVSCGIMVHTSLLAAEQLSGQGIQAEVLNVHTLKPLDVEGILESLQKTGRLITAEEHQRAGGLGSAVLEAVLPRHPVPVRLIAVQDTFGESGMPDELLAKYGLTVEAIVAAGQQLMGR
jgi:transketolase